MLDYALACCGWQPDQAVHLGCTDIKPHWGVTRTSLESTTVFYLAKYLSCSSRKNPTKFTLSTHVKSNPILFDLDKQLVPITQPTIHIKRPQPLNPMAGLYSGSLALDQPSGEGRRDSHSSEPWVEPWLIKHVGFYRKHMTKDNQGEAAAERRHSLMTEDKTSRESSVAGPSNHVAEAVGVSNNDAAVHEPVATEAAPREPESQQQVPVNSEHQGESPEPAEHAPTKETTARGWRKRMSSWRPRH